MTSLSKNEEAKQVILGWHERFRGKLAVPTESRTLTTRFGDTHVLVGGPASGPSVVVLHGAMASSAHALVELAPLLERFRVYAVDIIGQSAKSADRKLSVTNNDHGVWLGDVLDQLGLARAHVIGISWGGFAAIRLAAVGPERIDRLALLVPAGMVKFPAWAGFKKLGLPLFMYRMWPNPRRLANLLRHLLTTSDDDWGPYLGDAFRLYQLQTSVPVVATPAELAQFTRPTLVLGAERDLSFPGAKLVARASELFPALVGTELIAGSAHCPPTTAEFRRWLGDKLTAFFLAPPAAQASEIAS